MAGSGVNGKKRTGLFTAISSRLTGSSLIHDRSAVIFLAESFGILAMVSLVFYKSFMAMLILSPLIYPIYKRNMRRAKDKRKKDLTNEFKELLDSLIVAMRAGYSAENAFREAYGEMEFLFGRGSAICTELQKIIRGLDNNITLEELLMSFANDSGVDEIKEFAEVFSIAGRSGGNMPDILSRTASLIRSRIDVENEIGILISSRKLEQTIMDLVPFVIIIYISAASKGFFDVLYHNLTGIVIMTACLAVYIAAFILSEKITEIHV